MNQFPVRLRTTLVVDNKNKVNNENRKLKPHEGKLLCAVEKSVNVYDKIAKHYSQVWFKKPLDALLNPFVEMLEIPGLVLDAGCGHGRDTKCLLQRGIPTIGVDLSIGLLREAQNNVPEGTFFQMDIRHLEFPEETFWGIWACAVLVHIPHNEVGTVLDSFYKVLKPKGILFIALQERTATEEKYSIAKDDRVFFFYTESEMREQLKMAGFTVEKIERNISYVNTYNLNETVRWLNIYTRKEEK